MKIPIVIIKHNKKLSSGSYAGYTKLYDFTDLRVNISSKNKKDTFTFNILNHRDMNNGVASWDQSDDFGPQDMIQIYAYYTDEYTGTLSDHLLLQGFIENVNYDVVESQAVFHINGTNASDLLMNGMVPATFTGAEQRNVANMIITLVDRANSPLGGSSDRKITAALATVDGSGNRTGGGYIWPTKSDGSAFPVKTYVKDYVNLYTHLKTLASNKYTEDPRGSYIYYIDVNNELHFEPKSITSAFSIIEYTNTPTSLKKTMTTNGMINVVLLNAGPDPNNNGILTLGYDLTSVRKYGPKWKYISDDRVAGQIKGYEKSAGEITNSPKIIDNDNYPDSYNWEISQSSLDGEYSVGDSVTSNNGYKNYIRYLAKEQGNIKANDIANVYGEKRDEVVWEPELGTSSYSINDLVTFTFSSITFEKQLRVNEIQHSFKNEWITTIKLREDINDAQLSS